ncbi:sulfotransferase family protein [Plasticicumulans acidivorans]|uniref:Sulfotransferase family protein n=1 Tax=Plasticicumulans acidivorans TaxID=886464 RepID=A0A317MYH8_9GAMM|nr:hypothetical protein [Plasticicumulans acidivorans]PWV63352.1 hypothetical protein C7443_103277 [Plasticicumulans acidivorans]
MGKQALLVLGMHRSGTSALTGVLLRLGVELGPRLYGPQAGVNEQGFFEHAGIADANEDALLLLGSSWDDVLALPEHWQSDSRLARLRKKQMRYVQKDFAKAPLWGLKDPRICRLLPWWQEMLAELEVEMRYLIVVRDPQEVAGSLAKRDGFSEDKAALIWLEHNLLAERWTRGQRRAFLSFDQLLSAPADALSRVVHTLDIEFPVSLDRALPEIERFISPDLRHHAVQQRASAAADSPVAHARTLFDAICRTAETDATQPDLQILEQAWEALALMRETRADILTEHLRQVARDRGYAEELVHRIFRSWSWECGKPLRFVERLFGGDI